ncbi:MAG TPA: DUF4412 domain-containing protein [Chthoniobacterales bacterium]|jgi:hypothetical protein
MKLAGFLFLFCWVAIGARADLTMVQKVEGAGPVVNMTIKIKDDRARIDANPGIATIIDGKTGDMINLMLDQKKIVRISADKMKAAVDMMNRYSGADKKPGQAKPSIVATGKKEKVAGYDTEQFEYDGPGFKATYWVAPQYPNGSAILKQLEALNPQIWASSSMNMPDYHALNGVPIKSVVSVAGTQLTTTLVSVNQNSIDAAEFVPPKDFEEVKVPDLNNLLQGRSDAKAHPKESP